MFFYRWYQYHCIERDKLYRFYRSSHCRVW